MPSPQELLFSTAGAAVVVHQIFKKTETHEPLYIALLLLATPSIVTLFYLSHAASFLNALGTVFGTFWGVLTASILAYRVSPFHPLAKYPGPVICRLSKFYMAFFALGGKQHLYFARLHEQYGDVVRVGPNELIFRDPDAILPIIGPNGLQKGPFWDGRVPEEEKVKPLIAIRDKTEHLRRRRPWTRAFSSAALKGYEPIVTQKCVELVDLLALQKGAVDLTQWLSFFTYDVMNGLAFSGKSSMLRDGDVDGLWNQLEAGQLNAIFMSHVAWLGTLILKSPWFGEDLKAFRAHAKRRAMQRKKDGSPHKDIFHHLMDEDGVASHPPSAAEVVSDGGLAIIAGSDTTSSALTNLLFFLMSHPVQYQRLQAEIDDLGEDVMDYAKLSHLPYLNGAINEALRLLPPVFTGSQRMVDVGSGAKMLGSNLVPEGTVVNLTTYSIHRDPRSFQPAPESFFPERWLAEDQRLALEPKVFKGNEYILNQTAFFPFSLGQANCAGKNLAWIEMRLCIALILQRFELKFDSKYSPQQWYDNLRDYFVTKKGPLPTVLTPRRGAKAATA